MAFAFTQDVPIDERIYEKILAALGPEKPTGLLTHLVVKTDRGLRYVDVWESKDAWQTFVETKLHPVVFRVLSQAGIKPPEEPPLEELNVVHLW